MVSKHCSHLQPFTVLLSRGSGVSLYGEGDMMAAHMLLVQRMAMRIKLGP